MRGLIEKDFSILKQRKSFFLAMFAISICLAFTTESTFVIGYLTMLFSIFALSTLNYDEFDNSYAFLMTTPIDEKIYVIEKFVFGLMLGCFSYVCSMALVLIAAVVTHINFTAEDFLSTLIFLPLGLLFLAVNLPVQLKYGQEKSRLVLMGILGVVVVIVFVLNKAADGVQVRTGEMLTKLSGMSEAALVIAFYLFTAVCVCISAGIGIAVMKKKEF